MSSGYETGRFAEVSGHDLASVVTGSKWTPARVDGAEPVRVVGAAGFEPTTPRLSGAGGKARGVRDGP